MCKCQRILEVDMAVSLTFDAEGCYRALIRRLIKVSDSIMEEFYNDAISGLDTEGQEDSERINAIWDETQGYVEAKCKFYANALMQSFGTGTAADIGPDSYWNEYKNSDLFNPARYNRVIVGRPKRKYTDIYGDTDRYSSGANVGKNLETLHIKGKDGKYHQVKPIIPKYSIQNAENWLIRNHQRRVENRIEEELKQFFSEEASKFFVEVSI